MTSARAADILADIEQRRSRTELTPVFDVTLERPQGSVASADLKIVLIGPDGLAGLDEVVVRIIDERWVDHGARIAAGGPSAEDIAKHVWGPWEFDTAASTQISDNRTTVPHPYSRETGKDWDILPMMPSAPPYWVSGINQQQFLRRYEGQPLRLLVSCRLGEYRWDLPYEVNAMTGRP